jgi:tetratricopeptide (TPR) repeat protein
VRFLTTLLVAAGLAQAATVGDLQTARPSARGLYERGEYAAAIKLLTNAAGADMLELLGQCYYMQGDFKRSTEALDRAAAIAPNDSMIQTWRGRAWGMRAESSFPLAAMGHAGKSRDAFERAVRLDPKNQEALGDLFDFYIEAPGIVGGGVEKAEALLPKYAQYDPVGFHIATARIAEKKQQFATAEASFRKAVETSPNTLSVKFELAQFLARRGRYDESEKVFRQAEEAAPASPRLLFAKAAAYIHTHRNADQAREMLRKYLASALTPNDPPRWEAQKLLKKAEG